MFDSTKIKLMPIIEKNIYTYFEKLLSMFTKVIGANFKLAKSSALKSLGKHSFKVSSPFRIFEIFNIIRNPVFFPSTAFN